MKKLFLSTLFILMIACNAYALSIDTPAREVILIDTQTNTILFEKNADELMPPSSMSKLMTAYVTFDQLKSGKLHLTDKFKVSQKAWAMQGSKMFVDIDSEVPVEDLLRGMIIQSGNDACIVLAEGISGSEESFATVLNSTAKSIGLKNSFFVNATGWPHPDHRMTARDLSILAQRLMTDFPEYTKYYSEKEFTYHGIKQGNRNPLLYGFPGADGLKTGHTDDAGYGLTGTAMRDGRRLVLVVNGLPSMQARADESRRLMEWGFREFRNYPIIKSGQAIAEIPVWMGKSEKVTATVKSDAVLTVANADRNNVQVKLLYNEPLIAPVTADQEIGKLIVSIPGVISKDYPVYAKTEVPQLGWFERSLIGIQYMLAGH